MQLSRGFVCLALLLGSTATAHADGWVSLRGAWYKERSTRVIQPMLDAQVETSDEGVLDAHVLVDSITSASSASGAPPTAPFNELRYEGGVGYMHRVLPALRVGGFAKTSDENDYTANFVMLRAELELNDKNTVLSFGEGRGFDAIDNGVSVDMGGPGTPVIEKQLASGLTSISVTQVLTPRLLVFVVNDFMDLHGYQANVYRLVPGGDVPVAERVPELRLRNATSVGARWFIGATDTTLSASYRFYIDDWGIVGHTPEARVSQEVVRGLDVRLRYRFHTQTGADFYQDAYTKDQLEDLTQYVVNDEKLGPLTTHMFGGQIIAALSLLGVEGPKGDWRFEAQVDRLLQDTEFGNAWEAHVALVVPFAR